MTTLVNEIFREVLKFVIIAAVMVGGVFTGKALRDKKDKKSKG